MKSLLISALPLLLFISCDNGTSPSKLEHSYHDNAKLSFEYPYVSEGDSIVFHRYYVAEDEELIADDEYSESIYFTIPDGMSVFSYSGEALADLKLDVKKFCFCAPSSGIEVSGGSISGTKSKEKWKIEADFDFSTKYQVDEDSFATYDPEGRTFSATFDLKPIPNNN